MQVAQKAPDHSLDNFRKSVYAKRKGNDDTLSGWLHFLCTENADDAVALCQIYPWLTDLYLEMAEYRQNPEEVLSMYYFSEALRELDRNTIDNMIAEQKEEIERLKKKLKELNALHTKFDDLFAEQDALLAEQDALLTKMNALLAKKETLPAEQETLHAEQKALHAKTVALFAKRDALLAEKEALLAKIG